MVVEDMVKLQAPVVDVQDRAAGADAREVAPEQELRRVRYVVLQHVLGHGAELRLRNFVVLVWIADPGPIGELPGRRGIIDLSEDHVAAQRVFSHNRAGTRVEREGRI